jgi:hypothetical protein
MVGTGIGLARRGDAAAAAGGGRVDDLPVRVAEVDTLDEPVI